MFSAASFDGWINLYSVMGRSWEVQQMRQADKVCRAWWKCWREGTVSVQWENKGHKPGEKWGLLKNWETRALGSGTPGL